LVVMREGSCRARVRGETRGEEKLEVLFERVRVRLGMAFVLVGKGTLAEELVLEEGRREMRPERMRLSGGVARDDDDNELEGETGMRLVRVGSKSLGSLTGGRVTMP
jgi:hypothetical protein